MYMAKGLHISSQIHGVVSFDRKKKVCSAWWWSAIANHISGKSDDLTGSPE
jgi:hypothetical protein